MKRIISALLMLCLLCAMLSACADTSEPVTEVKHSIYQKNGRDYISFYLTAPEAAGVWTNSLGESGLLGMIESREVVQEKARYTTLILESRSEGEETFVFTLASGKSFEYLLKIQKDEDGILRITVK